MLLFQIFIYGCRARIYGLQVRGLIGHTALNLNFWIVIEVATGGVAWRLHSLILISKMFLFDFCAFNQCTYWHFGEAMCVLVMHFLIILVRLHSLFWWLVVHEVLQCWLARLPARMLAASLR